MANNQIGGTRRKVTNALAMLVLIVIFIAYMFPFLMVVINSLKEKRDIIKKPLLLAVHHQGSVLRQLCQGLHPDELPQRL